MSYQIAHNYMTPEEYTIKDSTGEVVGFARHLPHSHWYVAQWVDNTGSARYEYFASRKYFAEYFDVPEDNIYAGI